jgi:hypothetical protein
MKRPALLLAMLALAACSAVPPEQFHTLRPGRRTDPQTSTATGPAAPLLVIAPVVLPAWADRPQWVVRQGERHLLLLEQHRWAAPLGEEIAEGLAARLSTPTGASAWTAVPDARRAAWPARTGLRLSLLVQDWDVSTTPPAVSDDLAWTLQCLDGTPGQRQGRRRQQQAAAASADGVHDALTQAHGQVLNALADDIRVAAAALATVCHVQP